MINYAWANPSTGVREQAGTKEEARSRAWESLHAGPFDTVPVLVFEQEPVGRASNTSSGQEIIEQWEGGYAFTHPANGERCIAFTFDEARKWIAAEWPEHAPIDSVVIYRQRLAFEVHWDDPKPETPAPVEIPDDTPQSLIQAVMQGSCADLQRASLLANLWIAASLQEIAGALHYMSSGPSRDQSGLFARIRAWWRKFRARKCKECNVPLFDPDGTLCPECARKILKRFGVQQPEPESPSETPEQANERRIRLINERNQKNQ